MTIPYCIQTQGTGNISCSLQLVVQLASVMAVSQQRRDCPSWHTFSRVP